MKKEKRLITSALPYVNNIPHLGNIVGSHLPADIFSRYCKLNNYDAIFIGGTDEHGTPIEVAAIKNNTTPQKLADFYYKKHKEIYDWFNLSYDNFSRTSKEIHHKTVQEFLKKVYDNNYIKESYLETPYCKNCKLNLADRYIEGTCPICGNETARGDQCERCSNVLDPIQLKNPYCIICKKKDIEFQRIKHLFLDLTKLSHKLEIWVKKSKSWRPQVKSIALGWIKEGLKPRCISRNLKWGVKIPFKGFENLVFYVWAEAAIGYISSTKEWDKDKWQDYWKNKNSKIYNFIGKDNIPFHTLLFPGELIANGDYNLPYNVVGLQYLNYENGKFSKSKGHGVFCENLINSELDADYWRFYLTFIIPENSDTEFLWKSFQERVNKELVGNFGNFINRTLTFIYNKNNSEVKKTNFKDKELVKKIKNEIKIIINSFEKVELKKTLESILKLSDLGNKYFQEKEPWKNKDQEVLFICLNLCKDLALLIQPFTPESSKKILEILNCNEKDFGKIGKFNFYGRINKPYILFNKLEDKKIEDLRIKTSKVTKFFEG
jgi:methionyl-tRNA synthetase